MKKIMNKQLLIVVCISLLAYNQCSTRHLSLNSASTEADEVHYEIPRIIKRKSGGLYLERFSYTTSYNPQTKNPYWVGWCLTSDHTDGTFTRSGHLFTEDLDVPEPRALYTDIREGECGYQRGHICPAGDNKWAKEAQDASFLMTNISPQNGDLNQRDWKYLEEQCRSWAKQYDKVYIVAGPVFYSHEYKTVGENQVAVPDAFFKVVLAFVEGVPQAIGFVYENQEGHNKMTSYVRTIDYVESITGLDFFYQLPDRIEREIEACVNTSQWEFPANR